MPLYEEVATIIAKVLGYELEDIAIDSSLDDLGMDSVDIIEIILKVEVDFDLEISDEDGDNFKTVRQIYDYVRQHSTSRSSLE